MQQCACAVAGEDPDGERQAGRGDRRRREPGEGRYHRHRVTRSRQAAESADRVVGQRLRPASLQVRRRRLPTQVTVGARHRCHCSAVETVTDC